MSLPNGVSDWLEAVARRGKTDVAKVEDVLAAQRIQPSPLAASPRRLLLKRIQFSGNKEGASISSPFDFVWDDLTCGLWGMVSEENLRGKTSIIKVTHWLLKGKPANLQEDVKHWVSSASLRFQLDDATYETRIRNEDSLTGVLVRIESDSSERVLGRFSEEIEFEAVMSDFFMREFGLDTITKLLATTNGSYKKPVVHSWPALSGVMFIGTDYTSLLGDTPPTAGLSIPLMQMYLGLPWVSTLNSAKAVQLVTKQRTETKQQHFNIIRANREERIAALTKELEAKRVELSTTPTDESVRNELKQLSLRLANLRSQERTNEEAAQRQTKEIALAEEALREDLREQRAFLDSEAAEAIFRSLDPSSCPKCDVQISAERKNREKKEHCCSVCGEALSSNVDPESIKERLRVNVEASKAALNKAKNDLQKSMGRLTKSRQEIADLNTHLDELTAKLASFGVRASLVLEIAKLEARLEEISSDSQPESEAEEDTKIIEALVSVTGEWVKAHQEGILRAVSEKIVHYSHRFGMRHITKVELKGNANLPLLKNGEDTSYSKVTEGEKLRLKVATVLAMISVGENLGVGRHPGLLMIDSPGAQEVSPRDLEELITGLEEVAKEFSHLQVFVAARASAAITSHIPEKQMLYAKGDTYLW